MWEISHEYHLLKSERDQADIELRMVLYEHLRIFQQLWATWVGVIASKKQVPSSSVAFRFYLFSYFSYAHYVESVV